VRRLLPYVLSTLCWSAAFMSVYLFIHWAITTAAYTHWHWEPHPILSSDGEDLHIEFKFIESCVSDRYDPLVDAERIRREFEKRPKTIVLKGYGHNAKGEK